jgi:hypothetical protein
MTDLDPKTGQVTSRKEPLEPKPEWDNVPNSYKPANWGLWALEDSNLRPQPCEGCALTN